jgi:hypothetical protein
MSTLRRRARYEDLRVKLNVSRRAKEVVADLVVHGQIGLASGGMNRGVPSVTHPLVRDRINLVNSRILSADGKLHLFIDPCCRHSIEALEKHVYKECTSEPAKGKWDHVNDAAGA